MSGPTPDAATVRVPEPIVSGILEQAERAYPEECCGLLIGVRNGHAVTVRTSVACDNVAAGPDRRRRFMIEPKVLFDVLRALRNAEEDIVGIYHSHPDAAPELSSTDMTFVELWPDTVWLIARVGPEGAEESAAWLLPSGANGTGSPTRLTLVAVPGPGEHLGEPPAL